jgi:hypothetical protein
VLTQGARAEMRTLLLERRPAKLIETPLRELLQQLEEPREQHPGQAGRGDAHRSGGAGRVEWARPVMTLASAIFDRTIL